MGIQAIAWAQACPADLTSNEAFVLVTLAEYANDDGTRCWPAMSTVARKCRMSRSTVYRILDRLEHVHGVIRKERSGQAGGTTNRYRLLIHDPVKLPREVKEGERRDPVITPWNPPSLLDELSTGVCHPDTPPVASGATPGGVSPRDRGVASDDTGGVSPGATQPVITHQEPSPPTLSTSCGERHVNDWGEVVSCREFKCPSLFRLDDDTIERGRRHLQEMRDRLAGRSNGSQSTDGNGDALEGGG